jgi:hypothetical protein
VGIYVVIAGSTFGFASSTCDESMPWNTKVQQRAMVGPLSPSPPKTASGSVEHYYTYIPWLNKLVPWYVIVLTTQGRVCRMFTQFLL